MTTQKTTRAPRSSASPANLGVPTPADRLALRQELDTLQRRLAGLLDRLDGLQVAGEDLEAPVAANDPAEHLTDRAAIGSVDANGFLTLRGLRIVDKTGQGRILLQVTGDVAEVRVRAVDENDQTNGDEITLYGGDTGGAALGVLSAGDTSTWLDQTGITHTN